MLPPSAVAAVAADETAAAARLWSTTVSVNGRDDTCTIDVINFRVRAEPQPLVVTDARDTHDQTKPR